MAGLLAARVLHRGGLLPGLLPRAVASGSAGVVAGSLLAVLMLLASGPVGGRRLAAVGPSPWQVGLAVAVEVAVVALVALTLAAQPRVAGPLLRAAVWVRAALPRRTGSAAD